MSRGTLLYNPAEASTEELEALFVGREALLDTLLEELKAQHAGPTIQHFLVVGPRGSGKTHLTELLARRLAASEEIAWRTVRLPEEGYALGGLQDLIARVADLDAGTTHDWDVAVPPIEESLANLGRRRNETGIPLLVVLENLPRLIGRVLRGKQEIARLRSILMNDPPCTLVATATSYFEDVAREDRPLYDFFRVLTLEDLTPEQVEDLVTRRAQWDGLPAMVQEIDALQRRVRAIHHLSGGNPRLSLALYEVLTDGVSQDILDQFMRLLDQVTPYYQARLDDLTPQQALVLSRLALARGPLAPSELGRQVARSTSHTTAVLGVLRAERFVKRVPGGGKRRSLHAVTDRLFRIWLEMRESRGARRRLRFLVDFYRRAYTPTELGGLLHRLCGRFGGSLADAETRCCRDGALAVEYVAAAADGLAPEGLLSHLLADATNLSDSSAITRVRERAGMLAPEHPQIAAMLLFMTGNALCHLDRLPDGEADLVRALDLWPEHPGAAWSLWSVLFQQNRLEKALKALAGRSEERAMLRFAASVTRLLLGADGALDEVALTINAQHCDGCLALRLRKVLAWTQAIPSGMDAADQLASLAGRMKPDSAPVQVTLAGWAIDQGSSDEARRIADLAETLGPTDAETWSWLACVRSRTGDVLGFARAGAPALAGEFEESRRHVLSDVAMSLIGVQDPTACRPILAPLYDALREPDAGDIDAAYDGLWSACSEADPAWTAGCVALLEELVGEAPQPWEAFRHYIERDQDPAVLAEVHPEVREAVELLLEHHGRPVKAPPLMEGGA